MEPRSEQRNCEWCSRPAVRELKGLVPRTVTDANGRRITVGAAAGAPVCDPCFERITAAQPPPVAAPPKRKGQVDIFGVTH